MKFYRVAMIRRCNESIAPAPIKRPRPCRERNAAVVETAAEELRDGTVRFSTMDLRRLFGNIKRNVNLSKTVHTCTHTHVLYALQLRASRATFTVFSNRGTSTLPAPLSTIRQLEGVRSPSSTSSSAFLVLFPRRVSPRSNGETDKRLSLKRENERRGVARMVEGENYARTSSGEVARVNCVTRWPFQALRNSGGERLAAISKVRRSFSNCRMYVRWRRNFSHILIPPRSILAAKQRNGIAAEFKTAGTLCRGAIKSYCL